MTNVLDNILDVFQSVADWIVTAVNGVIPMFYTAPVGDTPGSLTFLGVLAIAGLAISVAFLLIGIIQRFLKFQA